VADVGSLAAAAPGHPRNWAYPVELRPGLPAVVPRGRGLGGSGAINGAVWTYVTPADAAGWGVRGWGYATLRYFYAIAEREALYATDGPVPVLVPSGELLHPSAERFLAAAEALGFRAEPDKNAGGAPGAGLVPSNSRDGVRVDPARAYLPKPLPFGAQHLLPDGDSGVPADGESGVPASCDSGVPANGESGVSTRRVGDFDTADGPGEAAGARSDPTSGGAPCSDAGPTGAAVGKPQGPAAGSEPQRAPGGGGEPPGAAADGGGLGLPRVAEPRGPAVRSDTSVERVLLENGRAIGVELAGGERIAAGEVVLCAGAVGTPRILLRSGLGPADTLRTAGIDVQLDLPDVGRGWSDHPAVFLPFRTADPPPHPHAPTPQAALNWDAGADPAGDVEVLLFTRPFVPDGDLHLMCSLQQPDSRGVLDLDRISYGYLRTEYDRRRLRHALRTGADVLRAGLGARTDPGGDVLGNDRALDAWIAAHLTTAVHLCGSAALGRVVDADLRVLGVDGLRVADTSVLPTVPRRGPAATAVAIGEKAAALLASRS
jgi:choline dehydrogenase-like flavoprotein